MGSLKHITQTQYARLWIILALFCLFYSGAIALAITFAKLPVLSTYLENIDIIRWSLVIHVNLATVVWFTAFPLGLIYKNISNKNQLINLSQLIGLITSVIGVVLIISDLPSENVKIYMSNYVPVLDSYQFFVGMVLYLAGAGLSYVCAPVFNNIKHNFQYSVGVLFFLFSLVTLLFSLADLYFKEKLFDINFHENLWWGFGHLLQHASAAFCLVCWCFLLNSCGKNYKELDKHKFFSFVLLFIPIVFVPLIIIQSSELSSYRMHFKYLMQYGIFPGFIYFLYTHKHIIFNINLFKNEYRFKAFNFSLLLMLLGFAFGSMIRGSDLRIPAHYHAVIGAVTLSFMVVCYDVFVQKKDSIKWINRCINIFTFGQILFSSSLFIAGVFGFERKTYADEHSVTTLGQNIVFILMPIGGLLAFAGGVCFAVAIFKDRKHIE